MSRKILFSSSFLLLILASLVFVSTDFGLVSAKPTRPPATPRPTSTPRPSVTPSPNPTPTGLPTNTPGPTTSPVTQITKKVLVLNFDPLINGTTPLHIYRNWNDPIALNTQLVNDVKTASHQYVNYQIVNTQVIRDYPVKIGGFRFTQDQFLGCLTNSTPSYCMQMVDYNRILTDYNVCAQVNSGAVDELWLQGAPYFGYYESVMAGPGAFWINGPVVTNTTCQKKLAIMGFNYERGVQEMAHSLGHRVESVMANIYGARAINLNTAWNRFSMSNRDMAGKASCGTIHFPPNGTSDYNYSNSTFVASRCEDWLNYPSTKGKTTSINCSPWGCGNFEKWWLTHLPYKPGTTNNKLNNWWAYTVDYDNAVARSGSERERWYAVEVGSNDSNTSCGTVTGANEVYFGTNSGCSPAASYVAKFTFPNIQIARNTIISSSNMEFVVDGPYTNALTERITLSDGTTTATAVTWPISASWTSQTIVSSPSLKAAVQQLVNSPSWTPGRTITATINHVSGSGARRIFAFEREPMAAARLIIK